MMLFFQFFKILISNLTGDQPGTGVGAILGEEPNRCVNFCVCSNCNELEIDNELVIECDLEIESENERSIQEQSENQGYPMLPPLDEPVFYGYGHILNRNVPTVERPPPQNEPTFRIDYTLNRHAPTGERPRPSPYTLEDRPTKLSNLRDLGC